MKKKTSSRIIWFLAICAAVLAWLSGYYVMRIVYSSLVGAIVFASVLAVIVLCESRFTSVSLRIDGSVSISKEEITSNLMQIVTATLLSLIICIPLLMWIYEPVSICVNSDLTGRFDELGELCSTHFIKTILVIVGVVLIYDAPILVRLKSEE